MTSLFETYPGGKGGCFRQIINLMPPHTVYIEPFLGGGAVLRHKLAAKHSIGIDLDLDVIERWRSSSFTPDLARVATAAHARNGVFAGCIDDHAKSDVTSCGYVHANAIEWLEQSNLRNTALIYADPTYLECTRRQPLGMYKHEMSDDDHVRLLNVLNKQRCMVLLSGYWSELYADMLVGWDSAEFTTTDRGGNVRTETLWANYVPPPKQLHDSRYYGGGWRERQRVRRKAKRWVDGLLRLPDLERQAILDQMRAAKLIEPRHK